MKMLQTRQSQAKQQKVNSIEDFFLERNKYIQPLNKEEKKRIKKGFEYSKNVKSVSVM